MKSQLKTTLLLGGGIVLSLVGIALGIKVLLFPMLKEGNWQIKIVGNQALSSEELTSVVLHLLQNEHKGLTTQEIEETLLLNPRIASVTIKAQNNQRMLIQISEREPAYLKNHANGLIEVAGDDTILQEQVEKSSRPLSPTLPIFYLTQEIQDLEIANKIRSDIISLWQKTNQSHGFLWGRISEIEIAPTTELKGAEEVQVIIYPVQVRSQITVKVPISEGLLSRLWAVFFYLEKNAAHRTTTVEINERNAIVKELAT